MAIPKQTKDDRVRNYATVVYPESAVDNWKEILSQHHVPVFISPLHDKDINPTGEPKKPHYHVMMMFEGKKSIEQMKEIFDEIHGVGVEKVKSLRGYARYLCHLDNPEKAQYDTDKVTCLGGADYVSTIGLTIDKYIALGEMQDFCEEYDVLSFAALCRYARLHRMDWFRVLADNGAFYIKEYLRSRMWSNENNVNGIYDKETGERLDI